MADGEIVFNITGNNQPLKDTLTDTTQTIKTETEKWGEDGETSAGKVDNAFASMIKKVGGYFAAAKIGQYILDFAKESVQYASDLEEVQNVVDVTFGASAKVIDEWAANASDKFGLTRLQAKQFSSTIGAMAKSSGMAGDEIVTMSTDLAGLAADMASFYNLDYETAFQKIRSGISGETEPLKQLGINMSEAALSAYALAEGYETAYKDMSQSERMFLRYQYLMSATADAHGDFERTSDGFANSVRQLETLLTELKATIGEALIGPVTEALQGLKKLFGYIVNPDKTLMENFEDINDATDKEVAKTEIEAEKARDLVQVLEDIGDPSGFLYALADGTDAINKSQAEWLETCRQLVGIIPELSEVVNVQTGEIKGGTQAVQEYIDTWEQRRKQEAAEKAIAAKEAAMQERLGEIQQMEIELAVAQKKAENARQAYNEMGGDERYDYLNAMNAAQRTDEEQQEFLDLDWQQDKMLNYQQTATDLAEKLEETKDDYSLATEELKEYTVAAMEWAGLLSDNASTAQAGAEGVVTSVAAGIDAQAPLVQASVDNINSILSQIGNTGGQSMWSGLNMGGGYGAVLNGSHADGLDFVPFDNYLASLHEGESILTAEEAKVWRNFKNGQTANRNSIDYGRMAGAIWDNAPQMVGGNVYLDGQTVGRVISASQANAYRNLQRSGWQA
jgi:hypothetical protein